MLVGKGKQRLSGTEVRFLIYRQRSERGSARLMVRLTTVLLGFVLEGSKPIWRRTPAFAHTARSPTIG
jgi:hypothetical protein